MVCVITGFTSMSSECISLTAAANSSWNRNEPLHGRRGGDPIGAGRWGDATRIPEALSGGRADSTILQEFMVKFAARDYTPTGRIDNMVKDLNGVQDLTRTTGTAMPLTAACAEVHRLLASAGLGGADNAALMKYFEGPGMEGVPT